MNIPESIPQNVRVVRYFSKEYLYELHTAGVVICNARTLESYLWIKRKGQVYIQTWHSSLRLKNIEKDAEKTLPESYIQAAKGDSEKIDYIISGCTLSSCIFKNSFWYDGKILECGTPRIDYLLKEANKKEIFKKLIFRRSTDTSYIPLHSGQTMHINTTLILKSLSVYVRNSLEESGRFYTACIQTCFSELRNKHFLMFA